MTNPDLIDLANTLKRASFTQSDDLRFAGIIVMHRMGVIPSKGNTTFRVALDENGVDFYQFQDYSVAYTIHFDTVVPQDVIMATIEAAVVAVRNRR